ncbi:hypothetical protein H6B15_02020 [Gemmiger formicilis]|uniref:hypothetical protein n=1 Tax=Gemmiger formicilis TaxID=745368 RepID=UPI00195F1962|nr:hypothetical protein [Gemmiger formicilis]MBM6715437.1 hypothetical protein [Gemmiger formicilis]
MAQQSPTPIPQQPKRVHRSGRVAAPARPAPAKPKRPGPIKRFFYGLARRVYFGAKTVSRIVLLLPILVFMVWVSYTVDRSGLFQGELAPRRIVDLMLQGYDVTNFESMDERQVVQLYAQDVPETPQVIGIGSSRVLQFNRDLVGVDSFFNMGVTGADVRDNMTSYYKMVTYDKAPEVLIWSVDPWVFYGNEAAYDYRADAELYNEFLTKVLGVPTDYEEPDKVELWKALVEPAYFQGNVDYYVKNRGQDVVTDDDGNTIEFNPVSGDPYDQTTTIKRSDGSVLYDTAFRNQTQEQILSLAAAESTTFNSVHMEGFDAMSDTQIKAFEAFIDYAHSQGTTVILVLSPWHPFLYNYLLNETDLHKGFFQVEPWLRQYCAEHNVPLYGSYDPECIEGLEEMDFFDGLHCKDTGIKKFFPGVPAVLQAVETNTLPDPLAVTPRTSLPTAEETAEGDAAAENADGATEENAA